MTYFSRNSCLYYTPSSGVDFLLVSFLAVSSQSKSSPTKSLHKHCKGMKTTIDRDCSSQCLHGGAGLHCKTYNFSMTISTGSMKKKKKAYTNFVQGSYRVLLYMYVKYRILTKYLHGTLENFLRGILAFHKNDKSLLAIYISRI